jgi:hypothetical protein
MLGLDYIALRGGFMDNFGDDFFGLRELGIADEYGLSSLSVPKRLLKGKGKGESKLSSSAWVSYLYLHRFLCFVVLTRYYLTG